MHEYSIVQSLIEQCEEHGRANHAEKITRVTVKIGRYSGVETDLLTRAFDTFKESTLVQEASLLIEQDEGGEMLLMRLEMEG